MSAVISTSTDAAEVLTKAVFNAGKALGLTQAEVGEVIGRERTGLRRGLDPGSKAGELALLLIRCYRSLFMLVGGDNKAMQDWLHTENYHLGGVPRKKINNITGLLHVTEYLDAMRGKV